MNYLALFSLLSASLNFCLGIYIYFQNKWDKRNLIFFLFSLSISVWNIGYGLMYMTHSLSEALFFANIGSIGIILIPYFASLFTLIILNRREPYYVFFISAYAIGLLLLLGVGPGFYTGVGSYSWGKYPIANQFNILNVVFFMSLILKNVWNCFSSIKSTPSFLEKNRYRYLLIANAIAFLGVLDWIPNYYPHVIPIAFLIAFVLNAMIGYTTTKHELLSVSVVITRGMAIVLLFSLVLISMTPIVFLVEPFRSVYSVFSVLAWAYYGKDTLGKIQTPLEKKFLKGTYNVNEVIKTISQLLIEAPDRWAVFKHIASELRDSMELKNIYIVFPCEKYADEASGFCFFSLRDPDMKTCVPSNSELLKTFSNLNMVVRFNAVSREVRKEVEEIGLHKYALLIPIQSSEGFQGMLILDRKLSEDPYTEKDVSVLESIMNQIIIALDRLHQKKFQKLSEEEKRRREQLQEANMKLSYEKKRAIVAVQELAHQASFSTLTLGVAHEIRNPLSAMQGKAVHLKDRLTGQQILNCNVDKAHFIWDGRVSKENLQLLLESDAKRVESVWGYLLEKGFINEVGDYNEKVFRPYSPYFEFKLDDESPEVEKLILTYLIETYIQSRILSTLTVFEKESTRVERICNNMMEYGVSGLGVSPHFFVDYVGGERSEELWKELIHHDYLDDKGMILDRFQPQLEGFSLEISDEFKAYESLIIELIDKTERAKKVSIDTNQFLRDISELFEGKFRRRKIEIILELSDEIACVEGHRDDLKQVFWNIFTNAYQAMELEDRPNHQFYVRTFQRENEIEIQLEDTGCGIPEDVIPKIMDPFFSTKGVTGGQHIGLGLSIVQQTVLRLGGKVYVISEKGKGTCFRLVFPV